VPSAAPRTGHPRPFPATVGLEGVLPHRPIATSGHVKLARVSAGRTTSKRFSARPTRAGRADLPAETSRTSAPPVGGGADESLGGTLGAGTVGLGPSRAMDGWETFGRACERLVKPFLDGSEEYSGAAKQASPREDRRGAGIWATGRPVVPHRDGVPSGCEDETSPLLPEVFLSSSIQPVDKVPRHYS
jgi:hypothetical protein